MVQKKFKVVCIQEFNYSNANKIEPLKMSNNIVGKRCFKNPIVNVPPKLQSIG